MMAPKVANLDQLIREIHNAFDGDKVDVDYVKELMTNYKSNPADWKKFAKFDRFRYTRNLVDEGNGKFNLMMLCWGEGHASSIHDHSNAHCFMKMLDGKLVETRFDWPDETQASSENELSDQDHMRVKGSTTLNKDGVCYINDSLGLHRVENPSHTDPSISLHLYCPPFNQCQMFDERTGRKTTCKVTFWSRYGEKCKNVQ